MNRSSTIAMTMTGRIMISTSTDIAHHCGPRVASCAATSSGIVRAFALVRISAIRYSFHEKIKRDEERRDEARHGDRQDDRADDAVHRCAVDLGCLLEFDRQRGEVVAHQPHDDRQVARDIGQDQGQVRVQQVDLLEQDVQRDHHRDRRQDPLRDQPEREVAVAERPPEAPADRLREQQEHCERRDHGDRPRDAAEDRRVRTDHRHPGQDDERHTRPVVEAHQGVGGARAKRGADHGAAERDDDAVHVRPERVVAEVEQDVLPGIQRRLEIDERDVVRTLVDLDRQLQRRDREPVQREQHDDRPTDQERVGEHLRAGRQVERRTAPQRVAHQTCSTQRRVQPMYTEAMTVTRISRM